MGFEERSRFGRDDNRGGGFRRDDSNERGGGFRRNDSNDRGGGFRGNDSNDRGGGFRRNDSNERGGGGFRNDRSQSRGRNDRSDNDRGRSFGGDDRKGGNTCFKCNETGHMARECPNDTGRGGGRGGGDDRRGGGGRGGGDNACFNCKEVGHMSRECPKPSTRGNGACFNCKEEGHMSKDCPTLDPNRPPASTYVPEEIDEDELYEHIDAGINFDKYDSIPVKVKGPNPPEGIQAFTDVINNPSLLGVIKRSQYTRPTPIQKIAIPAILKKRSMMSCAQTGSGKTAAFNLPMIQMMLDEDIRLSRGSTQEPMCLVLAPTRELAIQIYKDASKWAADTPLKVNLLYGGTSTQHQREKLFSGTHMLVGTAGRIVDFTEKGYLSFERLKFIVLDEADRLVDTGFIPAVRDLINHPTVNKSKLQVLMFSATFPEVVRRLAEEFLPPDHLFLTVGVVGAANSDVKQTIIQVEQHEKKKYLSDILDKQDAKERTIIFVKQKKQADYVATMLSMDEGLRRRNIISTSIHSDRTQEQREQALKDFRTGKMPILVATAVAARGIDIKDIGHVINYDMPDEADEYVHRIGRTGRVGNTGKATSFYDSGTDSKLAADLVGILEESDQAVPEWLRREGSGGRSSYGRQNLRKDNGSRDDFNDSRRSNGDDRRGNRSSSPDFNDSRRSNGDDSRRNDTSRNSHAVAANDDNDDDGWT